MQVTVLFIYFLFFPYNFEKTGMRSRSSDASEEYLLRAKFCCLQDSRSCNGQALDISVSKALALGVMGLCDSSARQHEKKVC